MSKTSKQFDAIGEICREIFANKLQDYGAAWRILRPSSLTDQIYIKANRVRSFEVKGVQQISESSRGEYIGIVNYSLIALIQLQRGFSEKIDISQEAALELYDSFLLEAKNLMEKKNHDYDEAWREMRISSFTDLILMKLFRVKQIEDNKGVTLASEGVDANYYDILNYAVFALIKTDFQEDE